MNPFDLKGKIIVISGGSSGIGRQCAIECAKMNARVIILGRNEDRLEETLALMRDNLQHLRYTVDLTDEEKVKDTARAINEEVGPIDGLLNVAGTSSTMLLRMISKEKMNYFFDNNVNSAILLTKEFTKKGFFNSDGGSIVFFSSIMGSHGEIGKTLYSMTKGALESATRSLACELSSKNIRVNSVSPGAIITPINENLPHIIDPEKRQKLADLHLLGLGRPEDVAYACVYLLSEAARWVTGTNLLIDGGYSVR